VLPEERERLAPIVAAYSEEDLLRVFDVLTKADEELRLAQDPRVVLELALLKLVQLQRLMPFAELVARVEHLAGGAPAPARTAPAPAPRVAMPAPAAAPAPVAPPAPRPAPVPAVTAPVPAASAPAPAPVAPPAAPPAPTPSAAPGSAGALIGAMIELAQTRPSLIQPLRLAQPELAGDTLTLAVPADFAPLAEMHVAEYATMATKIGGRNMKVRIAASGTASAAAEADSKPSPAETKKQDLMQQATREPAVQEALDLFGARIVDVREGS
jgi:DNA polymerase-3 subunit gamma/tau